MSPSLKPKLKRIYVPDQEWKLMKVHCAKKGISISAWVRKAIAAALLGLAALLLWILVKSYPQSQNIEEIMTLDETTKW